MQPTWTADIDVDASLAARLVAAQFPAFSQAAVEPFGAGWDNAAFLIGGRVVFRFPRRRAVCGLIEREIAILPHVAPRLPLAISAPHFIGTATAEYPWVFAGYEMIAGSTACSVVLSNESRVALAEPLGRFLRALHAIDPTPLAAHGLPPDEIGRLDREKRLKMTRERLPELVATGILEDPGIFVAWLAAHPPVPLEDGKRRLVHGDLYARYVAGSLDGRGSRGAVPVGRLFGSVSDPEERREGAGSRLARAWRYRMGFTVEGDYFETCNCDVSCNCIFLGAATQDHCDVAIGWHIARGERDGTDLAGLNVAMFVRAGKRMLDGNWNVALYYDERADERQADALRNIFSGQAGGHLAALGPLIGSVAGIVAAPITFESKNGGRRLVVGKAFEGEIQEMKGGDGKTAPVISNAPFGALPQPLRQGSSVSASYDDHWQTSFDKTNAFLAEFAYHM